MTDSPAPDEAATPVEATPETEPTLGDLRFIGPATETTLAEAGLDAAAILDRSISFVQLVKLGVEPGVAGHIRREYSLPWSDRPTRGERLRRRARHVRHLRPDEREWIDGSLPADRSLAASRANAASDGSGSATDAERAWRERSRTGSRSVPDDGHAEVRVTGGPETARTQEVSPDMESPINPADYTVPELSEALETIGDPATLATVLTAERAGDGRTTALEAIEDRLRAVGADPTEVASHEPGTGRDVPPREMPSVQPQTNPTSNMRPSPEESVTPLYTDIVTQLKEQWVTGRKSFDRTLDSARRTAHEQETRLRQLEDEEWQHISFALLLGFTVFSVMAVLATALQPAVGLPIGALPLFVVTGVVGVISYPLRWWETPGGYALAIVTGLLGLASVGLIAAGAVGDVDPGTASITLPAYVLIAVGLLVTTYLSRSA